MIATNHALTGALIGLSVGNPWIALPAALASHFVCDAIPHFGIDSQAFLRSKIFKVTLLTDALLCGLVVLALWQSGAQHWLLAAICAFIAASPDFWHIKRFVYAKQHKDYHPGKIAQFSSVIQWFQRPIGAVVEVAWAAGAAFLLANLI